MAKDLELGSLPKELYHWQVLVLELELAEVQLGRDL